MRRTVMKGNQRLAMVFAAALAFQTAPALLAGQAVQADTKSQEQKLCPVMGGDIDRSVFVDYQGERIYFCCAGCVETFNKDPETYVQKMKAQGIVLEQSAKPQEESAAATKHAGEQHGRTGAAPGTRAPGMAGAH